MYHIIERWLKDYCIVQPQGVAQVQFKGFAQLQGLVSGTAQHSAAGALLCKPQPNDGNISIQCLATLLGTKCCTHLTTLLQHVVCCWLKFGNGLEIFQPIFLDEIVFVWPRSYNIIVPKHAQKFDFLFQSTAGAIQHVATYYNKEAKCVQHAVSSDAVIC